MSRPFYDIATDAGSLRFNAGIGNLPALSFAGLAHPPLHSAPWLDDDAIRQDASLLPVERQLAGDFFCAPFGASDLNDAPAHGWSANSGWTVDAVGSGTLRASLDKAIMGARLTKKLKLADNAPLLYQEHFIDGGAGELTAAHHPMVRFQETARLCVSPKQRWLAPDQALDHGRNLLAPGQQSTASNQFPTADGGTVDLTGLPIADAHEDFVTAIEQDRDRLGWTAIIRHAEDDIVFFLKDPKILPVTMFWHSNAGRDYQPWAGRHRNVLGIEDGCAAGAAGHKAALAGNPIKQLGVPTALALGGHIRIAHVTGAIRRPHTWQRVAQISIQGDQLSLQGDNGETVSLPFIAGFFAEK